MGAVLTHARSTPLAVDINNVHIDVCLDSDVWYKTLAAGSCASGACVDAETSRGVGAVPIGETGRRHVQTTRLKACRRVARARFRAATEAAATATERATVRVRVHVRPTLSVIAIHCSTSSISTGVSGATFGGGIAPHELIAQCLQLPQPLTS